MATFKEDVTLKFQTTKDADIEEASFSSGDEIAVVQGESGYLQNPLIHFNYADKVHFQGKQLAYSSYDAGILYQEGVHVRPHHYLLQPWRQFWWRFVTLKGYTDGWHGVRLSAYMAYYEAVKYSKLARLWQENNQSSLVE